MTDDYTPPAVAPDPNVGASIRSVRAVNPKAQLDIIEPGLQSRYDKHLSETGGHEPAAIARLEREQRQAAQDLRSERFRRHGQPDNPLWQPLPPETTDFHARHLAAVMTAGEIDPADPAIKRLMADLEFKNVRKDLWPAYLVREVQRRQTEARWSAETERILSAGGVHPDDPEYLSILEQHRAKPRGLGAWVQDIARLALRRMRQDAIPATAVAQERGGRRATPGPGSAETAYRQAVAALRPGDVEGLWAAKERARKAGFDVY